MKVMKRSENIKRGTVMITIVHNGRSETRHCKVTPEGWRGYVLDTDRAKLEAVEARSRDLSLRLARGGVPVEPYTANLMVIYSAGDAIEAYRAHLEREWRRMNHIGARQKDALVAVELREQAERAKQLERLDALVKVAAITRPVA